MKIKVKIIMILKLKKRLIAEFDVCLFVSSILEIVQCTYSSVKKESKSKQTADVSRNIPNSMYLLN